MSVLHPWVLVGLTAALLPILLHLVARRQPPERTFPAVRYLEDATRDQRRRLRLRDLLLLLLRTAVIVALVLAAAGLRFGGHAPLGAHDPLASVLVLDNSASSAAVIGGEPILRRLIATAREVLSRAEPTDRLWLLLADGVARPGTATQLLDRLNAVRAVPGRLDLGHALGVADRLIGGSGLAGEFVVLTDGQRSGVTPAMVKARLVVLTPSGGAPPNRRITQLDGTPAPWSMGSGRITVAIQSDDSQATPLRLEVAGLPSRELLLAPGVPVVQRIPLEQGGWHLVRATLPPDEFRLDDARAIAVRVAPAPAVLWSTSDRFLDAALRVLVDEGRVQRGGAVSIGSLGAGASIVVPPEDPAMIGALNRDLAARGATWRYDIPVLSSARTDSTALLPEAVVVTRRIGLRAIGGPADTLVTVAGEPWIVRSGNLILVGSRFDPGWTALPVRVGFVPLLDLLATRVVEGEPIIGDANTGDQVALPPSVTRLAGPTGILTVQGGDRWTPPAPGLYWMLGGVDTLGAFSVALDPRESALTRATAAELHAAWPDASLGDLAAGAALSFRAGGRGDLRPLLLLVALLAALGESLVAGRIARLR